MQPDTFSRHTDSFQQLDAIKANDEQALQHLYQSGYRRVEKYVLNNKGSAEQAKDTYQDAFIAVWRNIQLGQFVPRNETALSGYLYQVAKNKWIDYLRSAHHKNTVSVSELHDAYEPVEELPKDQQEYLGSVMAGFRQLAPACKEVLTRFYYRNETMKTIAEAMEWTEATARNNKYRCLERLREMVRKKMNKLDRNISISTEAFEEIERYLRMQMTVDERKAFEQRLAIDAMLQDGVKQVQLMLTGIQEVSLRASLPHFHAEMPSANDTVVKISRAIILKRWLVAASIILVLAVSSWFLFGKKSQDEKIYAAYFSPDPGLISAMSITDNYVFDKAMIDYKTGNYTAAITAWEGLQQSDPLNDTLNYFIGTAYLANKDSKKAIPYLQMVIKSGKSFLVKDANWYTGLAMIKEHHLKEAIPLIERSEHPQKQALLQQLQQASQ